MNLVAYRELHASFKYISCEETKLDAKNFFCGNKVNRAMLPGQRGCLTGLPVIRNVRRCKAPFNLFPKASW